MTSVIVPPSPMSPRESFSVPNMRRPSLGESRHDVDEKRVDEEGDEDLEKDPKFQAMLKEMGIIKPPGRWSPFFRKIAQQLFLMMQLSNALTTGHAHEHASPDTQKMEAARDDVRHARSRVHAEPAGPKYEAEYRLPEVRGFQENVGIRNERIRDLLRVLPRSLIDNANTQEITFVPGRLPSVRQHYQDTTGHARAFRTEADNARSTTLGRHEWGVFQETADHAPTDAVRITAYQLLGDHDMHRLNQLSFRPSDQEFYSVHEMVTTIIHELIHGQGGKNEVFFSNWLHQGRRLTFDYTEGIVRQAPNNARIDWEKLTDEYRSEFIAVLLTKVPVMPGSSFRASAVQYFLQHNNDRHLTSEEIG